MIRQALVFVGTCDLAGLVRGKAFIGDDLAVRLRRGIGLTHSNIMMSPFGPIYDTPFGTEGDLMLVPDQSTKVEVEFDDGGAAERFYLGDIMTTDEKPWECCPRQFLRRAVAELDRLGRGGLSILAAFEQELVYTGVEDRPGATYALDAYRRQGMFGESYMAALRAAGLTPDTFLPEYGARQYEVTIAPARGLRAADEAVVQREMARAVAHRNGQRAIMAPILEPDGVGNGTHIHFSLRDGSDQPMFYDASRPYRLTQLGAHFVAGILYHLPALAAITAPSPASYIRLRPNRWAPTWCNIGVQDRGASIRVCPIFGRDGAAQQFNVEYRVCDAAASPYLALGALVWAGVDGIRNRRTLPAPPERNFWDMSEEERRACGVRPLPRSLPEALEQLAACEEAKEWFGDTFLDVYLRFKGAELKVVEGLTEAEICARYAEIY
ncbi:MAG TPA: glutamine synthetase family protein [Stellaceae bacterium]|nr:glutamine synthetase family protein [Stellaceae bacterium]